MTDTHIHETIDEATPGAWRSLLASLPAAALLIALSVRLLWRGTLYWSWAVGQWMITHHQVLRADHFSYALHGRPIVTTEWLFALAVAASTRLGADGPSLVVAASALASVVALAWYLHALGVRAGRVAWLCMFFALLSAASFIQGRAVGFSIAFLLVELAVITRARRDARWLFVLPALFALWINVHGSAPLGIAVLVVELVGALVRSPHADWLTGRSPRSHAAALVGALGASLLALCLTPWGPALVIYDVRLSMSPVLAATISEWHSPDLATPSVFLLFATTAALLARAIWRRRAPYLEFVLVLALLTATARSARMSVYLVVAMLALASVERFSVANPRFFALPASRLAAAVAVLIALGAWVTPMHPSPSATVPTVAIDHLSGLAPGRALVTYDWTGYAMARGVSTYVDARTDLYLTNGLFVHLLALNTGVLDPTATLARYDVRYVVWAPGQPLSVFLARDPAWRVVWRSSRAIIFARRHYHGSFSGRVADFSALRVNF